MELPPIVSKEEWQRAHGALPAKEKEATRARDAVAAERRRQPPAGYPQTAPYERWRPRDGYEVKR